MKKLINLILFFNMISFQSFYAQDSVESIKAKISHKENNG